MKRRARHLTRFLQRLMTRPEFITRVAEPTPKNARTPNAIIRARLCRGVLPASACAYNFHTLFNHGNTYHGTIMRKKSRHSRWRSGKIAGNGSKYMQDLRNYSTRSLILPYFLKFIVFTLIFNNSIERTDVLGGTLKQHLEVAPPK